MKSPKIIVLGGSGETGKRIINQLHRTYPDLTISSAARRQQTKKASLANLNTVQLDVNDSNASVKILTNYDLAIIALGPMDRYGSLAHQLCLQANIDAIDINDNLEAADSILNLHDSAKQKGRSLFTAMGFAPGLSSLLLAQLARQQASITGHYHCRLYMGAAYGGGETSPYAMIASFKNHMDCFANNQRKTVATPWKDQHSQFLFPAQKQALNLIPFATPEIASLASERRAEDLKVSTLDSRYHIQYLSQGFAKLLAQFKLSQGISDFFAKKFYTSGQSMKQKKDADPDTTLWVYPDGKPEQGLMVHGVVSSYDLTAIMACAVTDCWLKDQLSDYKGVYAVEHLSANTHLQLREALKKRGITWRHSDVQAFNTADIHFGWVDSACSDVSELRNFSKNWYSFEHPHPKMPTLQKRFLIESDIWESLKQTLNPLKFSLFVLKTLKRWREHNQQLAYYRQRDGELSIRRWKNITKDISMFTSGYSCAREVLGTELAAELYGRMFLETGKMEMRWLWPKPETFSTFNDPEAAIIQYWSSFMRHYQELGLFDLAISSSDETQFICEISNCAYAKMFIQLGCPELTNLVREMEQEALVHISSQSQLQLTWQQGKNGNAKITLNKTVPMQQQQAVNLN